MNILARDASLSLPVTRLTGQRGLHLGRGNATAAGIEKVLVLSYKLSSAQTLESRLISI